MKTAGIVMVALGLLVFLCLLAALSAISFGLLTVVDRDAWSVSFVLSLGSGAALIMVGGFLVTQP